MENKNTSSFFKTICTSIFKIHITLCLCMCTCVHACVLACVVPKLNSVKYSASAHTPQPSFTAEHSKSIIDVIDFCNMCVFYKCRHAHLCVCVHVKPEVNTKDLPLLHSTLFFETGSFNKLELADLSRPAGKQAPIPQHWNCRCRPRLSAFYRAARI